MDLLSDVEFTHIVARIRDGAGGHSPLATLHVPAVAFAFLCDEGLWQTARGLPPSFESGTDSFVARIPAQVFAGPLRRMAPSSCNSAYIIRYPETTGYHDAVFHRLPATWMRTERVQVVMTAYSTTAQHCRLFMRSTNEAIVLNFNDGVLHDVAKDFTSAYEFGWRLLPLDDVFRGEDRGSIFLIFFLHLDPNRLRDSRHDIPAPAPPIGVPEEEVVQIVEAVAAAEATEERGRKRFREDTDINIPTKAPRVASPSPESPPLNEFLDAMLAPWLRHARQLVEQTLSVPYRSRASELWAELKPLPPSDAMDLDVPELTLPCVVYSARVPVATRTGLVRVTVDWLIGKTRPGAMHMPLTAGLLEERFANGPSTDLLVVATEILVAILRGRYPRSGHTGASNYVAVVRAYGDMIPGYVEAVWRHLDPPHEVWPLRPQSNRNDESLMRQSEAAFQEAYKQWWLEDDARVPLYRYQECAAQWIVVREMLQSPAGGILGLRTGMGKTLTMLFSALLSDQMQRQRHQQQRDPDMGNTLVLCPKGLINGWFNEVKKWFPTGLRLPAPRILIASGDIAKKIGGDTLTDFDGVKRGILPISAFDIVVANYEVISRSSGLASRIEYSRIDAEQQIRRKWRRLIVDESHSILANRKTLLYKVLDGMMQFGSRWLLTATPYRSKEEMDIVNQVRLATRIHTLGGRDKTKALAEAMTHTHIARYGLFTAELPPTQQNDIIMFRMSGPEREAMEVLEEYGVVMEAATREGLVAYATALTAITFSRMLSIAAILLPASLLNDIESGARAVAAARHQKKSYLERIIDAILDPISVLPVGLQSFLRGGQVASTFSWMRDENGIAGVRSARLIAFRKLVATFLRDRPRDEKMVIIGTFKRGLELASRVIAELREPSLVFHGDVKSVEREAMLETFNTDDTRRFLLVTYDTGGAGLNLQRANHLVLFDGDWTASKTTQAMARVERLGQTRPVYFYELRSDAMIDQNLARIRDARERHWVSLLGEDAVHLIDDGGDDDKRIDLAAFIAGFAGTKK